MGAKPTRTHLDALEQAPALWTVGPRTGSDLAEILDARLQSPTSCSDRTSTRSKLIDGLLQDRNWDAIFSEVDP